MTESVETLKLMFFYELRKKLTKKTLQRVIKALTRKPTVKASELLFEMERACGPELPRFKESVLLFRNNVNRARAVQALMELSSSSA